MIEVKYKKEYCTHTLSVVGHANYAEYGKDIVCAGISSLVQALIGWIDNNDCNVGCISVDVKDGEVCISCEGGEELSAVFMMTAIGLEQIAYSYPDYVQIDIIGLSD